MIRFGPAGIPIQCEEVSTLKGVECCKKLGLDAMEIEFVRGVKMNDETAKKVKKKANELDVSISSHAPYYINLCTPNNVKSENSKRHIFLAAKATFLVNGKITVFHPGFYQTLGREEAFKTAKKRLLEIKERMSEEKIKCVLGAETVGKKSAFGGFYENIRMAQDLECVTPVLDFAHLHARGDFSIKSEEDYRKIFSILEKELPEYTKNMHCHFSEINYNEKGELNHVVLGTNNQPPYKPLMKVLSENGYRGTIICETPKLDIDALIMQREYKKEYEKLDR
ncbi:MAG: TIM barrel protein [Candidatus Micrarchaeota archaeon]